MSDLARDIVKELEPSEGWWREETEEFLVQQAVKMLQMMSTDDVSDILDAVIGVMRAEYGE